MARLVTKTATEPMLVGTQKICMCGLSSNQPFCDDAHKKIADEAKNSVYIYDDGDRREVSQIVVVGSGECCGKGKSESGCCGGKCHDH